MKILRRFILPAVLAAAATLVAAAPSLAATIHVAPGQSIQRAINHASPGDVIVVAPGYYHENLTIRKNDLTLLGGDGAVLLMPASPHPSPCSDGGVNGICIAGVDKSGNPRPSPVSGTTVRGFTVRGFSGFGVVLFNAADSTVRRVIAAKNGGYGISGFVLTGVNFISDVAHDNGEPGFYIGDSPNAQAVVEDNRAYRNGVGGPEGIGLLFRDSQVGVVRNNRAWGNCAGMIFVDSGENPAPAGKFRVVGNSVTENNGSCTGEPGGAPPLSGTGIGLLGARHMHVSENLVLRNRPSGPSAFPGGIVLASSAAIGGRTPVDDHVSTNTAFGNLPFDIRYDGSGTGNTFGNNNCGTSDPAWICGS